MRPRIALPISVLALLFSVAVAVVVLTAPAAKAAPSCGNGKFAVGGYPQTHLVPDGYTYTGTPGGIFFWEAGGYAHGQAVGVGNMIATVDEYASQCSGDIHIFGHSYGAGIVDTAAETINQRDYAHRVHVHVTGSPRHPGGVEDSWRGLNIVGMGFRGPVGDVSRLGSHRSDCNPRDAICDLAPWWNPLVAVDHWIGYAFGGTHHYGS